MKTLYSAQCAVISMLLVLCVGSCKKEGSQAQQYPIPANLQMISSGYATGAATRVEIYAAGNLYAGYNKLYIALYDSASNKRITQAGISLSCVIKTAPDINQPCPVENPVSTDAVNGLFNTAAIFIMPSAGTATCTITALIQNTSNTASGNFSTMVNVVQASPPMAYSVTTLDDSTKLFVSLVQPASPQIGPNNFEVTIDREIGNMSFVPDSSYTVMMVPEMPAMGGMDSPDNVNPVHTGNGHYQGKVVFVMDGEWQINLNLMHNNAIADTSHYFNITFSDAH